MIRRSKAKIIDQEIKERPTSSLSQKILGIGIFLASAFFLLEIILEYIDYTYYPARKLIILSSLSLIAIIGCLAGFIERRKDRNISRLGTLGNLSLLGFYAYVIFRNDYYLLVF